MQEPSGVVRAGRQKCCPELGGCFLVTAPRYVQNL